MWRLLTPPAAPMSEALGIRERLERPEEYYGTLCAVCGALSRLPL